VTPITLRQLHKNQPGITGLETAIILIAVVVIAALFTYTVLTEGLFSTGHPEPQAAVFEEAGNTPELSETVIATRMNIGGELAWK
jgi:flagellin FlaB